MAVVSGRVLGGVLVCVLSTTAMHGCSWLAERERERVRQQAIAHVRSDVEHRVAVTRIGERVCREMTVGVASREVIRGNVTAVEGERFSVRIDAPGVLDHTIGGVAVKKGVLVTDSYKNWLPCT